MKKLLALIFLTSLFTAVAEDAIRNADLSKQRTSWLTVVGGSIVAPPVATDYGFAVYTDGRMISASSGNGTILWQKAVRGRHTPYLSAFGDFLYVISDTKKLNLVNPSGLTLWTSDLGFAPVESPLAGIDGRVFVRGKTSLACYGINGKRKWIIITADAGKIPLLTCNDGTILAISSQLKDGKSTGIRVSPFGEILETITFTGNIIAAKATKDGILIAQDDRTVGFFTVENGAAHSQWMAEALGKQNITHLCPDTTGSTTVCLTQNGTRADAILVQTHTGAVLGQFSLGELHLAETSFLRATDAGFFVSDATRALEFTADGTIIWNATLPTKKKWDYLFYTDHNDLVICAKDWSIKGYLMNQSVEKKAVPPVKKEDPAYIATTGGTGMTANSLNLERLSQDDLAQISAAFDTGDYGTNERDWLFSLKRETKTLIGDYSSLLQSSHDGLSYFTANPVYTQRLIAAVAKTGTVSFTRDLATLISVEKEPAKLSLLIKAAGSEAYDLDGLLLNELNTLVTRRLTPRDTVLLRQVCDATYEICRFMGKPALAKKGRDILAYLFFPQFDKGTREYARQTLTKIMNLAL